MPAATDSFSDLWELDPQTIYLNHGSFGPSPVSVRMARQEWSAKLERQPMRFFCQDMEDQLDQAADKLADFVGSKSQRLALVDNATVAMNIAAASIDLQPGDEVLVPDHEYGAVRKIWQHRCRETGALMKSVALPVLQDEAGIVECLENAFTERTKVVVISHVTSPTALIFPVEKICAAARRRGILSVVDGPHAVAMLDLKLDVLGCDFYCASCHKWLCAPFGSGFLWVHSRHHANVRCPMVSWGGSLSGRPPRWQDCVNWVGTRDPAAVLSIPAAIEFFNEFGWQKFRCHAHQLVTYGRERLLDIDGIGPFAPDNDAGYVCMSAVELPRPAGWKPGYHGEIDPLQRELREVNNIEIPVTSWNGRRLMRISAHLYNSQDHLDRLAEAVAGARNLR